MTNDLIRVRMYQSILVSLNSGGRGVEFWPVDLSIELAKVEEARVQNSHKAFHDGK
jgi:hypothetical protein